VLKVECPGHRNPWAAKGLQHWAGRGAARLFDSDEASQVLLLERCVPGTNGDDLDVATGNTNQEDPNVPGYPSTTGWDAVTGLGTPNAANLVPDLVAAANGH